jgi:hypothetical protein
MGKSDKRMVEIVVPRNVHKHLTASRQNGRKLEDKDFIWGLYVTAIDNSVYV